MDVWVRYAVTLNNQYTNAGDVQIFPKNMGHINVRVDDVRLTWTIVL